MPGPAPDETRHAPPGTGSNTPPPSPGLPGEEDGPPTAVLARAAAPAPVLTPPSVIGPGTDPGPPTGFVAPPPDPERTGAAHVPVIIHPNEMFPEVGSRFLHFEIMEELGRGSFARVYLARQESLANRLVVLKVTQDATDEPQKLARLRHTNIVPVYSVHEAGPFQAVCMPYLGRVTLGKVLADLAAGAGRRPATGWALLGTLFGDRGSTAAATGSERPPGKTDPAPPKPDPNDPPPTQVAAVSPFITANAPPDIRTGLAAPAFAGGGWLKTPGQTNAPLPDGPDETSETLEAVRELSFVGAALWLAARLAAGLAHAHGKGILHRDLKPANVLVTDDGVPMLLDFNVSVDTTRPDGGRVGGTMRYMAPEHLRAFGGDTAVVDERSDLYALGLILHELLTGTLPYAPSPRALLAVRERLPPRPGLLNPAVSPAVDSIVLKLLHPDPAARYASAHDLREDLGRQLRDRPLRFAPERSVRERAAKWKRRNPGLATAAAVGLFALVFLILPAGAVAAVNARRAAAAKENQRLTEEALTAAELEKQRLAAENARAMQAEAEKKYRATAADLRDAAVQLAARSDSSARDQGMKGGQDGLARYGVGTDPGWAARPDFALLPPASRAELKEVFGEVLLHLTWAEIGSAPGDTAALAAAERWNQAASEMFPPGETPTEIDLQRASISALKAGKPLPPVSAGEPRTEADLFFTGLGLVRRDRHAAALPHLARFTDARPDHFRAWFARGVCHDVLNQPADAAVAFAVCCALRPNFPLAYVNRGLARLKLRKYPDAEADLTQALSFRPGWAPALVNRGLARDAQRRHAEAVADFDAVLADPAAPTRVLLLRSRARRAAGDAAGADADLSAFRARTPADAPSWAARGTLRMAKEPDAALADFDAALAVNPNYRDALLNKAILLADHLHRPADAARVLDHLLDLYPDHVEARAGRGVYLARTGDAARARADGAAVIRAEPTAFRFYQVAGLHAQLAKDDPAAKGEALRLLGRAFRAGFADFVMLKTDSDLDPVRDDPAFRELVAAAAKLGGK